MKATGRARQVIDEIQGTKAFRWTEDMIPELEEQLAEIWGLEHYESHKSYTPPEGEDYDGPMLRDSEGNGYAIVLKCVQVESNGRELKHDRE